MIQKVFLVLILLILLLPSIFAENCGGNVVLNTDCNIATQLIDSSNNPVETASCDANLFDPNGLPGFTQNSPLHWESGIYLIETDANFSSLGIWVYTISCIDGSDRYFGTTEFNIVLSDAEISDPNNCEIEILANSSKKTNALIFSASGFDSKRISLGLNPTINIFDLDSGVKTINQKIMLEQIDVPGLYTYYFTGVFQPSTYGIRISFDDNCSKYEEFEVEKAFLEERQNILLLEKQETEIQEQVFPFWPIFFIVAIIAIIIFLVVVYNKWIKRRISP